MKTNSVLLTALIFSLLFQVTKAQNIYKDANQPISKRVNDLLSQMTLEEKVAQVTMAKDVLWDDNGEVNKKVGEKRFSNGIGTLWYSKKIDAVEMAKRYNASQEFMLEGTRLGIPALFFGEGLHGYMALNTTMFPQAIAMASTWDPDLIENVYSAIAIEMRARGPMHAFTPVIGLARDPRWGRTDETYGEDPFLVGQMGVAAINGLQGRNAETIDKNHVAATAKHFVAHSQPQDGTNRAPVNISKHILRENFFYPFELAVKQAHVKSIMASYNEIDGIPVHCSKELLTDLLRKEWGFSGLITSDADAIDHLHNFHFVAEDKKQAAKMAIEAGIDIELAITEEHYCFYHLIELVESGEVSMNNLNAAVSRVLKMKFELGLFDDPYVDVDRVLKVTRSKAHNELALKTAEKAIVLLKNQNTLLPLDASKIKNLAIIGPNALNIQYGSYSMVEKDGVSVLDGFNNYAKGRFNVKYAEGCKITNEVGTWMPEWNGTLSSQEKDNVLIKDAVAIAESSDAVILVIGGNELTCREAWSETHLGDRDNLDLLGNQNDLVQAVLKTGKPVVVILINGRPLTINEVDETIPAILECWYLGEETGTAIAKAVFGEINPGGKLPITFPRSVGQLPCFYNHKPSTHDRSYLFANSTPLYPFGYGLSYTSFAYSNLIVTPDKALADDIITVSVDIENTGKIAGDEVVQLYIRDNISSVTRPVKELKGFKRITLASGETKTVKFIIGRNELQFYNRNMKRVVEAGDFTIMAGGNSEDLIKANLEIIKN